MQIETFDPEALAKLITDQAVQIARLKALLVELRVSGVFPRSEETQAVLKEVDQLLEGERPYR